MVDALAYLYGEGKINSLAVKDFIAATSAGIVAGEPMVDLCFKEDFDAAVDMNLVMTGKGEFVEVQGAAEKEPCTREEFYQLLDLAAEAIKKIIAHQRTVLGDLAEEIERGEKK